MLTTVVGFALGWDVDTQTEFHDARSVEEEMHCVGVGFRQEASFASDRYMRRLWSDFPLGKAKGLEFVR